MSFREALDRHLNAIRRRDLPALIDTLPARDFPIVLVMADGKVVRSVEEFVALHRDWFASPTWELGADLIAAFESRDLGVAVLRLDYRDRKPDGEPFRQESVLTLVFADQGGRWVMVQDQNTPIKG